MKFEIILKNLSPYHSTQAGNSRYDMKTGRINENAKTGFPLTRTRHMPMMSACAQSEDRSLRYVPIMPAASLRHALREQMLEEIFNHLRGRYSLSRGAYAACVSGAATGNPDGVPGTFEEMRKIAAHPFLGLFGGGPRMMTGKLSVDMALPISDMTVQTGLLPEGLEEQMTTGRLTHIQQLRRVDPLLRLGIDDEELITDAATVLTEYHIEQTSGRGGDDEDEAAARGLNALNFHEIVVPGVSWYWRIKVKQPTSAQVGLLLLGIQKLHDTHQGGMSRLGYGRILIDSVLMDGKEIWTGADLAETDATLQAVAAWAECIDDITPQELEDFAASRKEAKAKPKARRRAKDAAPVAPQAQPVTEEQADA